MIWEKIYWFKLQFCTFEYFFSIVDLGGGGGEVETMTDIN